MAQLHTSEDIRDTLSFVEHIQNFITTLHGWWRQHRMSIIIPVCKQTVIFCEIFTNVLIEIGETIKVVTDEASLRHEFRVSTGRNPRKSIKNPPLRHFACILRHNIAFLPVETRNTCLSEAASGTTFIICNLIPSVNSRKSLLYKPPEYLT